MGGLEYTTDGWNSPHPKISAHSEGAFIRHPHCYIRGGYYERMQATRNPSYAMAKGVSTAPSYHIVWGGDRVNAATVSRGGHSVSSPAGKASAWRLNCRHFYICIRCRIRSGTSHISIKMLLSPFCTIRYCGRGR